MAFNKNFKPGDWVIHTPSNNVGKVVANKRGFRLDGELGMAVVMINDPVPAYADGPEYYYYTDEYFEPVPFVDAGQVKLYNLHNGDLLMVLTEEGRADLPNIKFEDNALWTTDCRWAVEDDLLTELWYPDCLNWAYTNNAADNWGQMSNAPALTDPDGWEYLDDNEQETEIKYFWYYEQYATKWWVDEIEKSGYVIWKYQE